MFVKILLISSLVFSTSLKNIIDGIEFPAATVKDIVITFQDVRSECMLDNLITGSDNAGCNDMEQLKQVLKRVIVRRICTVIVYEINLKLVDFRRVTKRLDSLKKQNPEGLKRFISETGLDEENILHMIWERLNTLEYLKVHFSGKIDFNSDVYKNWLNAMYEEYNVKEYWNRAVHLINKRLTGYQ